MANTPPRPPINVRPEEELVEDLCRELRHVAVSDGYLPGGERVVDHIREVCALHAELAFRRIDVRARLERLAEETHWQISSLLADCLAYPRQLPYVREHDGIRRYLRCHLCAKAERSSDAELFWFCEACMGRVLDAVRKRSPIPGVILFRTYNMECRCSHADADTVLAGVGQYWADEHFGFCEQCIEREIARTSSQRRSTGIAD